MYLTLFDCGVQKLDVIGPRPLNSLLENTRTFAYRDEKKFSVHEVCSNDFKYSDKNVSISPKFIAGEGQVTVGYLIQGPQVPGKFDAKKANELKVPVKIRSRLVAGETVVMEDGSVFKPEDCVAAPKANSKIAFFDFPHQSHVDFYLKYHAESINAESPSVIFYDISKELFHTPQFLNYIEESNPNIEHVLLGNFSSKHIVFTSATINQHKLHALNPLVYPLPFHDELFPFIDCRNSKVQVGKCLLKFDIEPQFKLCLSQCIPSFEKPIFAFHEGDSDVFPFLQNNFIDNLTVSFLGTGSAIPCKNRNVSGIYMQIETFGGFLMDAGEGSLGQLFRLFGSDEALYENIISSLKCIFVTHMHADHHLGIISILIERNRILLEKGSPSSIFIVAPRKMFNWLKFYSTLEAFGEFNFIDCMDLIPIERQDKILKQEEDHLESLKRTLGFTKVIAVPVIHCDQAYGFVVSHQGGWKLVYSGDTRPCKELAVHGNGADLLIHEATFEDDLSKEAIDKNHSTVSEAISIAQQMGAKSVILTHFSQRYPKIPVLNNLEFPVAIAFDLMTVKLSLVSKLYSHWRHLQEIFSNPEEEDEEESK